MLLTLLWIDLESANNAPFFLTSIELHTPYFVLTLKFERYLALVLHSSGTLFRHPKYSEILTVTHLVAVKYYSVQGLDRLSLC